MKLTFTPYFANQRHQFTIAGSSRLQTELMLVRIEWDGLVGYGEASMPPYLGESHSTVSTFLSKVDLKQFLSPFQLEDILTYVDAVDKDNNAAKAALDIALHDLYGKALGKPLYEIWGLNPDNIPNSSFTIGIDTPEVVKERAEEAKGFKILKIKLGSDNDKALIEAVRSVTDVPICVDANRGWTDRAEALDLVCWLQERGTVFVEQPFEKDKKDDTAWLNERSPLPIVADEAVKRLSDIKDAYGVFSGINIKLMKSTGLREAMRMINAAKALNMKVMLGCMSETSCAVGAMSHLSPLADWVDLDGHILISNDLYDGLEIENGKVVIPRNSGIGVRPNDEYNKINF